MKSWNRIICTLCNQFAYPLSYPSVRLASRKRHIRMSTRPHSTGVSEAMMAKRSPAVNRREGAMMAKHSPAKAASDAEKQPVAASGASDAEKSASDAEPASDDENETIGNDDNDENEEEEEEELDAVGFGDAMSKILGQSVAGDAQPILAKRTTARMREILADKQGSKTARVSAAEKREKEQKDMVVPDHSTAVLDRRLRGIATKGGALGGVCLCGLCNVAPVLMGAGVIDSNAVVALFNAIEKHQHQSGKKTDEKSDKKGECVCVCLSWDWVSCWCVDTRIE